MGYANLGQADATIQIVAIGVINAPSEARRLLPGHEVMVQKQAKQVFGLGVACRLIRYRYRRRRRYRTDQLIRQAPR